MECNILANDKNGTTCGVQHGSPLLFRFLHDKLTFGVGNPCRQQISLTELVSCTTLGRRLNVNRGGHSSVGFSTDVVRRSSGFFSTSSEGEDAVGSHVYSTRTKVHRACIPVLPHNYKTYFVI